MTLDVTNADVDRILNDITNQLGLQVIKLIKPNAKATVKCHDVPLQTALSYIFIGTNYSFKNENGAYFIGNNDSKDLENTKLVKLNYLRADNVKKELPQNLLQKVTASVSIEHNAIILTGSNQNINNLTNYIKIIDQPVTQVLIEAIVIDYNLNKSLQLGITAGSGDSVAASRNNVWFPGLDITRRGGQVNNLFKGLGKTSIFGHIVDFGKLGKLPSDFFINLRALERKGIINVKSRPILSTINGHKASLKIGTIQNYVFDEILPVTSAVNSTFIQKETIQKIEATISFEITPWVGRSEEHTSELQSHSFISYAVFCLKKKKK